MKIEQSMSRRKVLKMSATLGVQRPSYETRSRSRQAIPTSSSGQEGRRGRPIQLGLDRPV